MLTLERHGARTLANLRVRIATRLLTLAACIALVYKRHGRACEGGKCECPYLSTVGCHNS